MSNIEFPDTVSREALAWVERLRSGRMTVADADALQLWRRRSLTHAQAFAEAAVMARLVREASQDMIEGPARRSHRPAASIERRAFLGAAAAAAVGYMVVDPPLALWPSLGEIASNLKSDYTTAVGERRSVHVADAMVELNTQSGLAVLRGGQSPEVELVRGEAMVDASRTPFTVGAGVAKMTARQARFNIRLDRVSACVTCVSGSLEVVHPLATTALAAGEQLIYSRSGVSKPWRTNVSIATAWHRGMLTFHNEPLSNVVAEVNRYRGGRIVILKDSLARQRVYASFHLDKIDTIVDQLQLFSHAQAYSVGNVVFLS